MKLRVLKAAATISLAVMIFVISATLMPATANPIGIYVTGFMGGYFLSVIIRSLFND